MVMKQSRVVMTKKVAGVGSQAEGWPTICPCGEAVWRRHAAAAVQVTCQHVSAGLGLQCGAQPGPGRCSQGGLREGVQEGQGDAGRVGGTQGPLQEPAWGLLH